MIAYNIRRIDTSTANPFPTQPVQYSQHMYVVWYYMITKQVFPEPNSIYHYSIYASISELRLSKANDRQFEWKRREFSLRFSRFAICSWRFFVRLISSVSPLRVWSGLRVQCISICDLHSIVGNGNVDVKNTW